ncbi:cell wall hydrolase [Tahibacter caeni]|uniref:cell wall hydrolase n=1 Tax=Tahibacter caeni TaxID=1453545 RepID=UPI002148E54E|nr:cell wall hydrolase [Tahibacter caeni]
MTRTESSIETAYRWLSRRRIEGDAAEAALQARFRRACRRWFRNANIRGIGTGLKHVRDVVTPVPALCVYVQRKSLQPGRPVPPVLYLPPDNRPVLTDVVELERVRAACQAGGKICNAKATAKAGTATAYLEKINEPGSSYLLGCAHVLAPAGATVGDTIQCRHDGWNDAGLLTSRFARLKPGTQSAQPDFAIVSVPPPDAADLTIAPTAKRFAAEFRSSVIQGETLVIHGSVDDKAHIVTVTSPATTVDIHYPGPPAGSVRFSDLIVTTKGSEPGDSGAPVVDTAGRLVGYVVGDNSEKSFIQPIAPVLKAQAMRLYGSGGSAFSAALGAEGAQPPATLSVAGAIDTLARTIWGEARGEKKPGRVAVAWVVLNRTADAQKRYGQSIEAVCLKPKQFSCWNAGDPNLAKLKAVTDADTAFRECLDIAAAAVGGKLSPDPADPNRPKDPTKGGNHYHTVGLQPLPHWAEGKTPTATIGRHVFYRL